MSKTDIAFAVAQVFGGLALFIFGMQVMSEGLQRAAGSKLRGLLYHLTRNRVAGLGVGTSVGFLVHSSATTVMLVGFVNAGLMTLAQSVPVTLGANVGTTLSMQVISFKLDAYCWFAVAVGFLLQVAGRKDSLKNVGSVIFGFGLLFLGIGTMSAGVEPLKGGPVEALLRRADAATFGGMVLGVLISTAVTSVIQSSGATVGILFALSSAGVFTEFGQVMPLLLGAHIGTCATALLGCIGTGIEAKRVAVSHLLFNVLGTVAAIAMSKLYLWLVPMTSGDLVRQIANAHTIIQTVNALLFLPFSARYARLVERLTPSRQAPAERSHLRDNVIETPEMALLATLRETQRMAHLVREEMAQSLRSLVLNTGPLPAELRHTEEIVDELKLSIREYLVRIAMRRLSQRQAMLVQHLLSAVGDLERIGDHSLALAELGVERRARGVWFDDDSFKSLMELYRRARSVLAATWRSLEPQLAKEERCALAQQILAARNEYLEQSRRVAETHRELVRSKSVPPLDGLYFGRMVACLDKTVEHSNSIAALELEPVFFVKETKLGKQSAAYVPSGIPVDVSQLSLDDTLFGLGE